MDNASCFYFSVFLIGNVFIEKLINDCMYSILCLRFPLCHGENNINVEIINDRLKRTRMINILVTKNKNKTKQNEIITLNIFYTFIFVKHRINDRNCK